MNKYDSLKTIIKRLDGRYMKPGERWVIGSSLGDVTISKAKHPGYTAEFKSNGNWNKYATLRLVQHAGSPDLALKLMISKIRKLKTNYREQVVFRAMARIGYEGGGK